MYSVKKWWKNKFKVKSRLNTNLIMNPSTCEHQWVNIEVEPDNFPPGSICTMWTLKGTCKICGCKGTRRQWGFI